VKTDPGGRGGPLASLGRDLPLPLPVPDWSKPIIALLLVLVLGFALRWWVASRRARMLEAQQRSLIRDLDVLQAALVPEVPSTVGGLDVSVAYHPAEGPAAGGDFYDVFQLDEHRVAVMLGDVTGHGHEALQRATQARYTLRAHIQEERMPRRALARTSQALTEPGFEQLATVALAVFDHRRGTLTYALAGHPAPILLGTRAPEAPLACSSPPLGWDMPTGRRQRTVSLPAGARVCFFSDGLIEARMGTSRSAHGTRPVLLGPGRLRRLIEALPPQQGAPELLAAVREHSLATPDDMAACIITARDGRPAANVDIEELEVGEATLERGLLDSFLSTLGLSESVKKGLMASVRERLRDSETATVLVDRAARKPRVRVAAAGDHPPAPGDGVSPGMAIRA
jgi:serine phosphatase RsbU (regulator of sigma subunit)